MVYGSNIINFDGRILTSCNFQISNPIIIEDPACNGEVPTLYLTRNTTDGSPTIEKQGLKSGNNYAFNIDRN